MNGNTVGLGREVKDRITGFKGTVTGMVQYITGCDQALVAAKADKSGDCKTMWVDIQRLEVVSSKVVKLDNSKTPGFGTPAPIR